MDSNIVITELEEALKKANEGFVRMKEAKELLMEADAAMGVSALKCEVMADKGDEKFRELMEKMDFMRSIVSFTLDKWPTLDVKKPK